MDENLRRITPFNPLDKRNLADSIAAKLLQEPLSAMPPEPFIGAGVYALYYRGAFPLYAPLICKEAMQAVPIYVGKAVPKGSRKGGFGLGADPGTVLRDRLCDHAKSIDAAQNLRLEDFLCRFLVVEDIWIPLAESILIETFAPIWNKLVDGFGNHDPGVGRTNQRRSPWDVLHPGRQWADRLAPCAKTQHDIEREVRQALTSF